MKKRTIVHVVVALAIAAGLFPALADAADVVAEVENQGDKLIFHPVVEFKELVLTVVGPCNYLHRQVVTKGSPYFELSQETIDGVYNYELVVMPNIDSGIIEVLHRARQTGDNSEVNQLCRDGKLPGDPATQAAGFHIREGRIEYDPGAVEEKTLKAATSSPRYGQSVMTVTKDDFAVAVEAENKATAKDFVINDDLIVDGSACIGFDCVNGESFGFDTIRVKENNLRIKFDDTSTAASFPRNDWQLTANDSANGGASKFSIDDISGSRTPFTIEANARSHSLYVDDGGRIGSRTSTPSVELHTVDGDTPTLRLQQDGSSGFAPQTWDVAGNETNFFIRDVTNGSQLPFRIRPDAPTSSIDISTDGDVGIGTASPDYPLEVERTGSNASVAVTRTSAVSCYMNATTSFGNFGTINDYPLRLAVNSVWRMRLDNDNSLEMANGATCTTAGQWLDNSSRELKENIDSLTVDEALGVLEALEPVKFNYKVDSSDMNLGFIAEDVPDLVATKDRKHMSSMDVVAVLTKAVQELHRVVEEQQQTIDELKRQAAQK